jgi:hypothetical protein
MRKRGYNSIALSSCYPSAFQIACLIKKFYNINLCLDNDFWGHIGALTVARVLEWPIYLCNHKDPGESDQLQLISRDYLEDITLVKSLEVSVDDEGSCLHSSVL